jgi:hypothetical protein
MFKRIFAAAVLSAALGSVHAQEAKDQAIHAVIADGVSTAVGLAAGAAEMNPLGPLLAMGMKAVLFRHAASLPDTEQPTVYAAAASVWSGAAANNICVTASILSGGSFAPACLLVGAAWAYRTWKATEHERTFWEGCALLRHYAQEPALQCVYTQPEEPVVIEATAALPAEAWAHH